MRSLLIIIGILLVVCAADVFGMGKSDGSKEKVEKPLKKAPVEVVAKPVKVEPIKVEPVPVKIEPAKKPVETPAKIEPAKPAEKPAENKAGVCRWAE